MNNIGMIVYIVLLVAVFYFMLIRPQKKQQKAMKAMLDNLAVGDKIVTVGGIHGKILKMKDDTVVLETGSGEAKSTLTLSRNSIASCLTVKE
ncbi:MAG: preprotein translocase subunit YajC [Clostridia bacterium]|nr:preprotein translocase subunit YajC [Oscillospiraceae bacterium]MBQ7033028.1 preprotein translocase subunit YajC [Clostridia bacterium]